MNKEKTPREKREAANHDDDRSADESSWGDDEEENDDPPRARRLFTHCAKPAAKKDGKEAAEPTPVKQEHQQALLALVSHISPPEWDDALRYAADPIFQFEVAARFVKRLDELAPHMRRGYIERRERLSSPRGRVVPASAARSDEAGTPEIECQYDDFSPDKPLHRLLVTALRCAIAVLADDERAQNELPTALSLRRRLSHVEPLPVPVAAGLALRLRLTAGERTRWHEVPDLAKAVLHVWSPRELEENEADPTPDVAIPSASLWEGLIKKAAKTQEGWRVAEEIDKRRIGQPWALKGSGKFLADIVVWLDGNDQERCVILDAKYQWRPKSEAVNPGDALRLKVDHVRQLFAYGVLWPTEDRLKDLKILDVGLVYLR